MKRIIQEIAPGKFSLVLLLAILAPVFFAFSGCPSDECTADADCVEGVCSAENTCVGCNVNADCGADAFCCQSECLSADNIEANCGCAPQGSTAGTACSGEKNVCTVGGERADVLTVSEGICGCPCDATTGGTLCTLDTESADGFTCGCDRADEVVTCEGPVLDNDNYLHQAANNCSAVTGTCTCEGATGACGTGGLPADCSSAGCVTLRGDSGNCGVGANDCKDATRGLDDGLGVCLDSGCQCDAASDCTGAGLNVDSCALVGDSAISQCVCTDYDNGAGEKAACPLSMECVDGGCDYYGEVVATEAELFELLGISVSASEADAGAE